MCCNTPIEAPKRSWKAKCFCPVSSYYYSLSWPDEFSVTTERIVLKFWDMVDMDVKLCKMVSKFKMLDSKIGLRPCPKTPKFCPDYFSLYTVKAANTDTT